MSRPILVAGFPRSGTHFVQSLLSGYGREVLRWTIGSPVWHPAFEDVDLVFVERKDHKAMVMSHFLAMQTHVWESGVETEPMVFPLDMLDEAAHGTAEAQDREMRVAAEKFGAKIAVYESLAFSPGARQALVQRVLGEGVVPRESVSEPYPRKVRVLNYDEVAEWYGHIPRGLIPAEPC